MFIRSTLTEKDFINANFVLLYSKISTKIFTGFVLMFLIVSIITAAFLARGSFSQVLTPVLMMAALPLMTYFTAKRNFNTNLRNGEAIEYHFDPDNLSMKGESFNSQLTWGKIYKVTHTKNWLLIWQSRQMANPIPKRDIAEGQIGDLKQILDHHKVKNNL